MSDFDFSPAQITGKAATFSFSTSVAEVLTINAVSKLPANRLQSKTQFGIAINAVGKLPRLQSKAMITKKEFKDKYLFLSPARGTASSVTFTFTKPAISGLIARSYLPRIQSRAVLTPPQNINSISVLPRLTSATDVYVPFAIVANQELPRLQSFTRILIPPITIVGQSPLPRLQSQATVQVPYIMVAKARFRLFSAGSMNVSVNAVGDGYFGALQSDGLAVVDGEITKRRRRTSTSVN